MAKGEALIDYVVGGWELRTDSQSGLPWLYIGVSGVSTRVCTRFGMVIFSIIALQKNHLLNPYIQVLKAHLLFQWAICLTQAFAHWVVGANGYE